MPVGRDGRVAEGGGLLNRYTVKSRIGGSNPPLSASFAKPLILQRFVHVLALSKPLQIAQPNALGGEARPAIAARRRKRGREPADFRSIGLGHSITFTRRAVEA